MEIITALENGRKWILKKRQNGKVYESVRLHRSIQIRQSVQINTNDGQESSQIYLMNREHTF